MQSRIASTDVEGRIDYDTTSTFGRLAPRLSPIGELTASHSSLESVRASEELSLNP
jgi:hypothetical protein